MQTMTENNKNETKSVLPENATKISVVAVGRMWMPAIQSAKHWEAFLELFGIEINCGQLKISKNQRRELRQRKKKSQSVKEQKTKPEGNETVPINKCVPNDMPF